MKGSSHESLNSPEDRYAPSEPPRRALPTLMISRDSYQITNIRVKVYPKRPDLWYNKAVIGE